LEALHGLGPVTFNSEHSGLEDPCSKQTELPFVAQLLVLAIFVVLTIVALKRFNVAATQATA
jgi:hypothetical protein